MTEENKKELNIPTSQENEDTIDTTIMSENPYGFAPQIPPMPPIEQSDDYDVNEYGEIVRGEGRSR